MRTLTTFIFIFVASSIFAQIGIGTTTPKAQLDIVASNQATPANTDGILIPRVGAFPTTNPTIEQNGMLVFLTTDKTFYYWDHGNTTWVAVNNPNGVVQKIDDLSDGKSDGNGSSIFLGMNAGANDDGTDNQNIGVGYNSLHENIGGSWNTATGYSSMSKNETGSNNTSFGSKALYSNLSGNKNTAIGNSTVFKNETGSNNTTLGAYTLFENVSGNSNVALGFNAGYSETGSNKLYIENSNADADNALIYGEFDTNVLRTNSEFQIGNPTGTGYAFPITTGITGQILELNASGDLIWGADDNTTFTAGIGLTLSGTEFSLNSHDWYKAGTTTPATVITDDITTQGKVGIGGAAAFLPLSTLDVNGNLSLKVVSLNGGPALSATPIVDGIYINLTPTSGNDEFILENAASVPGRYYILRNISSTINAKIYTIGGSFYASNSSGVTLTPLIMPFNSTLKTLILISDGVNWTYLGFN